LYDDRKIKLKRIEDKFSLKMMVVRSILRMT